MLLDEQVCSAIARPMLSPTDASPLDTRVGAGCGNAARPDLCGGERGNSLPYRDQPIWEDFGLLTLVLRSAYG